MEARATCTKTRRAPSVVRASAVLAVPRRPSRQAMWAGVSSGRLAAGDDFMDDGEGAKALPALLDVQAALGLGIRVAFAACRCGAEVVVAAELAVDLAFEELTELASNTFSELKDEQCGSESRAVDGNGDLQTGGEIVCPADASQCDDDNWPVVTVSQRYEAASELLYEMDQSGVGTISERVLVYSHVKW
eukprot:TRINITY_DN59022_c0_g1_i1.p1 TRINITY_DN59022_c0_g1~~TRINITY_DN59022_c0_g1_i1.p1  ORF type:complete len:190 (+),score=29.80 TRINITY_DN59022_c0_g1_i1:55-624(+)